MTDMPISNLKPGELSVPTTETRIALTLENAPILSTKFLEGTLLELKKINANIEKMNTLMEKLIDG